MSGKREKRESLSPSNAKNFSELKFKNSLMHFLKWKGKTKIRPTSAMRINAYAIPLRERIVIISNRGRCFLKYAYKNLHQSKYNRGIRKKIKRSKMIDKEPIEKPNLTKQIIKKTQFYDQESQSNNTIIQPTDTENDNVKPILTAIENILQNYFHKLQQIIKQNLPQEKKTDNYTQVPITIEKPFQLIPIEEVTQLSIKSIWRECLRSQTLEIKNHMQNCKTCSHVNVSMLFLSGQLLTQVKYPKFSSEEERKKSFVIKRTLDGVDKIKNNKDNIMQQEIELVQQGFFYDAEDATIICFSCGLAVEIINSKEKNCAKLHLNSGLFCAHNVKIAISMLIQSCNIISSTNIEKQAQNVDIIKALSKIIITAGIQNWKKNMTKSNESSDTERFSTNKQEFRCINCGTIDNEDNITDCPWIFHARSKNIRSCKMIPNILNLLIFIGSINDQSSFLNRLLTFNEELGLIKIISLSQNGLFCTDRNKNDVKCCGCDMEIINCPEDIDSWKEHLKRTRNDEYCQLKCSFHGINLAGIEGDGLANTNRKMLNNLHDVGWYPSNNCWRCKHCETDLVHTDINLKNVILRRLHENVLKEKKRVCEFLKTQIANDFATQDKNNSKKNCFCRGISQKDWKFWDKHDGRGLNCETAIKELPVETIFKLEYELQYNTESNINRNIEILVKRRKNFKDSTPDDSDCGKIYFQDDNKSQRLVDTNYEICSDQKQFDNLLMCTKECTKAHYNVCCSILGTISYDEHQLEKFFSEMIHLHNKLMPNQGIIFLTEGLNTFAMQKLGNAIRKKQILPKQHPSVNKVAHVSPTLKAVGIVQLDKDDREKIRKKWDLFRPKRIEMKIFDPSQNIKEVDPGRSDIPLNPDHTEFIFIEAESKFAPITDANRYEMHAKIKSSLSKLCDEEMTDDNNGSHKNRLCQFFRFKKQKKEMNQEHETIAKKFLWTLILVGGEEKIIEVINKALTDNVHVIICKKTGGVADELAKIYWTTVNKNRPENYANEVQSQSENNSKDNLNSIDTFRNHCIRKACQITVIDLTQQVLFTKFFFGIFFPLVVKQLEKLGLLRASISADFRSRLGVHDFSNEINTDLYCNEMFKTNLQINKLEKLKSCLNNKLLTCFIQIENLEKGERHKENIELTWHFEILFIWAILTDRDSFAKYFLRKCRNIIVMSLIAAYLYRDKRKQCPFYETNYKKNLKELKENYEKIAIDIIDRAYSIKVLKNEVFQKLQEKHVLLSMNNCIEAAAMAKSKKVFCTEAFGNMMDCMWYSTYATAVFVPQQEVTGDEKISFRRFPFYVRIDDKGVHVAPITKFSFNLAFFVSFLIYYVVVILILYESKNNIVLEGIIFTWVVGFLFEEIYEMVKIGSLPDYFGKSRYNIIDVFIKVIGFTAFFLSLNLPVSYDFAKYFYWINGLLLIFRLFREFAAFKSL